jgi:RNA-binding protein YlmH
MNVTDLEQLAKDLAKHAQGGRVVSSDFLPPNDAAALEAKLRDVPAIQASSSGGVRGAKRRIVSAFPEHIPAVTPALAAIYVAGAFEEDDLRSSLQARGLAASDIGDVVRHQDGLSAIVQKNKLDSALELSHVGTAPVSPTAVDVAHLETGSDKDLHLVVPSLRVDVLGAKAFKTSRAYFSKGIASGNVSLNGQPAGKSSTAAAGDEIYADGLGWVRVVALEGSTKKGNHKVHLRVERNR